MRILYVDPISTRTARQNILGIQSAYKCLGEVLLFDYRVGIPRRVRARIEAIGRMNHRLYDTAVAFKPNLIHLGKSELIKASTVQRIKDATGAFVFYAFGDWRPEPIPFVWQIGHVADVTGFSNSHPGLTAKYYRQGVKRIEFWCAGFDPGVYRQFDVPKRFETVFMANMGRMTPDRVSLQGPREKFIYALAAAGVSVHLFGVNNRIQAARSPRVFSHDYVSGADFSKACSEANIALGFGIHNVRNYTSWPRLVNSMASGTLFLTRYFLGLENFFRNRQHLVWFRTIPEAVQLVKYYLAHPQERDAIAQKGKTEILRAHTWDERVKQVVQWAGLS